MPVLMAALGRITGTDTAAGDQAETIAIAPSTLWSLTMDRDRPGSLVQSVDRLASAARAVRDQLSSDTWVVLAGVERALAHTSEPPDSLAEADAVLATAQSETLVGMLTLAGVAGESMVQDVGWTMMDIGKRIERGVGLTALLGRHSDDCPGPGRGTHDHRVDPDRGGIGGHLSPSHGGQRQRGRPG